MARAQDSPSCRASEAMGHTHNFKPHYSLDATVGAGSESHHRLDQSGPVLGEFLRTMHIQRDGETDHGRRLRCADRGSSLYCGRLWCQAEGLANPSSYQPLPASESTIDDKVDARDERRSAARKEYGGTDHFLRRRQATHRRVPCEYLHLVGNFRPTIHGC